MSKGFSQAIRDYVAQMPCYTGVATRDENIPCLIVKLPATTPWTFLEIRCGALHQEFSSRILLTLSMQGNGFRSATISCLLTPTPDASSDVLRLLLSAKQIEVYAITPELGYLGTQFFVWQAKKRRQLAAFSYHLLHSSREVAVSHGSKSVEQTGRERPSVSSFHEQYRQKLYEMHQIEQSTQQFRELQQRGIGIQWTQTPLLSSLHTFEENVLAHVLHIRIVQQHIEQLSLYQSTQTTHPLQLSFPKSPLWIDCPLPLPDYWRKNVSIFCFREAYESRPLIVKAGKAVYRLPDYKSCWRFDVIDQNGNPLLRLFSRSRTGFVDMGWTVDAAHICPRNECQEGNGSPTLRSTVPNLCSTCAREATFWCKWGTPFLIVALGYSLSKSPLHKGPVLRSVSEPPKRIAETLSAVHQPKAEQPFQPRPEASPTPSSISSPPIRASNEGSSSSTPRYQQERKPVIVTQPLLIDRYIQKQAIAQKQNAIEQANKYLWMHSAWVMTECFQSAVREDPLLRLTKKHIYIELEQPRQLFAQPFAACSFLCLLDEQQRQRWQFNVIDSRGTSIWSIWYEVNRRVQQGKWVIPQDFHCPDAQCKSKEALFGNEVSLCDGCQQRVNYYTTWIAVALRVIAGDFQEQVELREPEEVLEVSTKQVRDEQSGAIQEKKVLRHFRVIRYYDACIQRSQGPQTKRGSWMSGKPLAESEYDPNFDAIIYVQIQPREHDRTYRHDRYTQMKGKSQHIEPQPRLQPMTIATFRQLPRRQTITKVYASTFEEAEEVQ